MISQFFSKAEQENRTNSVLLTGLEFNCTVRDSLCPSHLLPIDLNVIQNWVQFLVMSSLNSMNSLNSLKMFHGYMNVVIYGNLTIINQFLW